MKFLVVLVVTILHGNWLGAHPLRGGVSPRGWFNLVAGWFGETRLGFLIAVVLPTFILMVLFAELRDSWLGLLYFLGGLLVLLYCVEFTDIDAMFDARALWLRDVDDSDDVAALCQSQRAFRSDAAYEILQSVLVVVFFFLILGPAGALFYALIVMYDQWLDEDSDDEPDVDGLRDLLGQVLFYMEWLPARVSVLVFALFGNFASTAELFVESLGDVATDARIILGDALCVAIAEEVQPESVSAFRAQTEMELATTRALLERSQWGWVGVAALLTILGF